jgi:hypothetical protein
MAWGFGFIFAGVFAASQPASSAIIGRAQASRRPGVEGFHGVIPEAIAR